MRLLEGWSKICVALMAGIWSVFLVYTAVTVALHPILQGSISLSFGLAIVFLTYPFSTTAPQYKSTKKSFLKTMIYGSTTAPSVLDIVCVLLSVFPCLYIMFAWETIVRSAGYYENYQLVLGFILVIGLLDATRRSLGNSIPILMLCFLGYALFGENIPGMFGHAGFQGTEILYQLFLMQEGIWGLLTDMTSKLIALFILFGPVLFATGVGKTFMDIAMISGGRIRGGAGHVAVVGSSFFGMLSGSSVANVATTGSFTIPTMKRLKFPPAMAGAVEASASSGGQIMPPIMGAGCFIMAEFLNISYISVMIAGIIPGLLYFIGVSAGIWVEAGRYGIGKLPDDLMPKLKEVFGFRQMITFLAPVGILMTMLFMYFPAEKAAGVALIVAMVNYLLIGGPLNPASIWERLKIIWEEGFLRAVITALAWLMVMMSCVQMAVTMISMTGFGVKVSAGILGLAGTSLVLALIATMLIAMLLGMGMTTTAAYVIAAAVLVPALEQLGLPALASHLFIFYFAIKSGLTPPVCITVFAAAAIAGSPWLKTAWYSMRLGIGGYILPFYFILMPAYLMQGSAWEIGYCFFSGIVAMLAIEAGLMGFLLRSSTLLERIIYFIAGLLILGPFMISLAGYALFLVGYLLERFDVQFPILAKRPAMDKHYLKG
ncbi:MAG TPA: TRAP transporter fused permease subunit [Desulforhopalus sp.]|nr:TRAP transporter fused permease subunit [Desulforhopalus sp.]